MFTTALLAIFLSNFSECNTSIASKTMCMAVDVFGIGSKAVESSNTASMTTVATDGGVGQPAGSIAVKLRDIEESMEGTAEQ